MSTTAEALSIPTTAAALVQRPSPLTFLYSNLASILPEPIIGLIQEYYVVPKEVTEFLKLVAEGEQDQAEIMLQSNPALALVPGDVTDLSKRTFNNITAFQYAVWALDWHMWTMIRKHLPDDAALEQAQEFETGAWVRSQGVHANLNVLIQAYQTTIDLYKTAESAWLHKGSKMAEADKAWVQQVGGAQRLLPAHVVNEYCRPTRSFYPLPNFKDGLVLPRTRTIEEWDWFTAVYSGGKLGEKFACYRGAGSKISVEASVASGVCGSGWFALPFTLDHASVRALTSTRTAQREELIAELRPKNVQSSAF